MSLINCGLIYELPYIVNTGSAQSEGSLPCPALYPMHYISRIRDPVHIAVEIGGDSLIRLKKILSNWLDEEQKLVHIKNNKENFDPDQVNNLKDDLQLNLGEKMNLENSDILFLASSFTQLSSLHYSHLKRPNNRYPQEFIIKILETANIMKLTLRHLSSKQVKSIFDNFDELRIFSFSCGKNIPESLETIEIRIVYDFQWNFSADSLRKFFEGW
ncbi:11435_t:CDS:2, partial [Diversispora eburnea]